MTSTKLINSGLWITFGNFAQRFFALLSNLLLARLLIPSDFGVIAIAYVFWSFFTLFNQNSAGLFILYKGTEDKRYLDTTYAISLIVGLLLALSLIVTSPLIASFFNEPSLKVLLIAYAFNLLLSSIYYVYVAVMTSQMQYQEIANINLISSTARLICTTASALLGFSYWSFAVGDTVFWVLGSILTRYKSGQHLRLRIDPKIKSEVISYCMGAIGSSIGFYANSNLDNFVVGKLLGKSSLGFYNLAYQLSMAISSVLNPVINQLGTPVFAKINNPEEQKKSLIRVTQEIAFLATPLFVLIFLLVDQQMIALVFGSNWIPVASILPWLLFSAYFRVINSPLKSMLAAKGLPKINAQVNLSIAPVAVLGFFIGAKQGGAVGVSISAALILGLCWTIYWWWMGCRTLGWSTSQFLIPCCKPILIALLPLTISFYLPSIIKPIVFLLFYLVFVRILAPKQFLNYYNLINKMIIKFFKKKNRNPFSK